MPILDRHIAALYLRNVFALLLALMGFVLAVDLFLNLSRFLEGVEKVAGENPSTPRVIGLTVLAVLDLWGPRFLQLFNYLAGFVLIAAMGFTCVSLVRRRELVAILASGVSLHRVITPFVLVALFVTLLQAVNQEALVPRVAHLLPRTPQDALRRDLGDLRVPLLRDGADRYWYAARFDLAENALHSLTVWELDDSGALVRRISAPAARWDGRGWVLENGAVEVVGVSGSEPIDRLDTDLDPTALLVHRVEGYGSNLSWTQIRRTLSGPAPVDPATRRRLDTIRFGRLSMMASNLLTLLIALPFFLVREPRGMLAQSIKCAAGAGAALIGSVLGATAALPGLPVWLGVMTPALALTPIAIARISSIRT